MTPPVLPLSFDSEVVRLRVVGDSLEVEGLYRLICQRVSRPMATLLYPFPEDSLLGGARMCHLECRTTAGPWQPASYGPQPHFSGVRWTIPTRSVGDTLEVRAIYRQAMRTAYARYIVTSTHAWGRPLRHARFEITLPPEASAPRFSFPFVPCSTRAGVIYVYEADEFYPDRDITVEWTPAPR